MSDNLVGLASIDRRPNLHYDLINPETGINYGCPEKGWRYSQETMRELIDKGKIIWPSSPEGRPRRKKFLSELQSEFTGLSSLLREVPTTSAGTQEIRELFGTNVFDFPKPLDLVKVLIDQGSSDDDIVLDFFAGSCPAAQAVLELNREDGGSRRFVMVQLAEPTAENSPAREAGYPSIAELGKERIRRAIDRMRERAEDGQLSLDLRPDEDLGFKVFKLAPSTFREWEPPEGEGAGALEEQLALFDRGVAEDADPTDVIYEVILKLGYSLNARIEPLEVGSNRVYRVVDEVDQGDEADQMAASFYVCLDDELADETIDVLPLDKETTFVCLDTALDDSQKVNLAMGCLLKVI